MYRSTLAVYSVDLDIYARGGMGGIGGIPGIPGIPGGIGGMAPLEAGDALANPWEP